MKKHILGTICTLALSLFTALGANQNSSEAINEINGYNSNIETETTEVEDTVNNLNEEVDIKKDKVEEKETPEDKSQDKHTDKNNIDDTQEEDKKNTQVTPTEKPGLPLVQKPAKEETQKEEKEENIQVIPTEKTDLPSVQESVKEESKKDESVDSSNNINDILDLFKSKGGKTFVYKDVDLSQCETTEDIVDKLQDSGYYNGKKDNANNMTSLEEILNQLQNGNGQKIVEDNNNNKAETKAPEAKAPETKAPEVKAPVNENNGSYANDTLARYADEVLQLVNQERAKAGLSSLTSERSLTAAANVRAKESRQSFSHTRPNGTSFSTALKEHGVSYRTSGENIAYGQRSPEEVVNGWMNSPGHRANILNASFNKIGIGVYQQNGTIYWSQLFTN